MPPTPLIDTLTRFRRTIKLLGVVFGIGVVITSAVALLLSLILADYLLNLPEYPRFALLLLAVAFLIYALIRWIAQPLLARLHLTDLAGRLEQAFPQFGDRLRSTVDFLQRDIPGSDVMKQRTIDQASALAQQINLHRAVAIAPVGYSLTAGVAAIALTFLLATTANPRYVSIALSRLISPFGGAVWPKTVQIDLLSKTPPRVPVGQRVELKMRLAKGDRASLKALVVYRYGNGPQQQQYMTRNPDGSYAALLDAKTDSPTSDGLLTAHIKAGDDELPIAPIAIVRRLAITRVQTLVTPPAYARQKPSPHDLTAGPATVVLGSDIALRIEFNKPLDPATPIQLDPLSPDMKLPQINWDTPQNAGTASAARLVAQGRFPARNSLRFHIRATDTDGFTNTALEEFELIVRPDQNPTVQIENPRRNEERTPVSVIPLQGVAEDDFGIDSLHLVVDRLGDKKHWEIPLLVNAAPTPSVAWNRIDGTAERLRFRANYAWDLAQLADANLKPGDVLEYALVVRDNFALDGQYHAPVSSSKLRITIISQDELTSRLIDELRQVSSSINDIRNTQMRTREETANLRKDTEKKDKFDAADRLAADRLGNQQSTAASQAKTLAGKLDAMRNRMDENKSPAQDLKDLAADVKTQLNTTAENPMKDAAAQLNTAKDPRQSPDQRNASLDKAAADQQTASDQLQKALDRLGNIGSLEQMIDRIRDLLNKQQDLSKRTAEVGKNNLGKTPDQMTPEDRAKLEKIAAEQNALSNRADKTLAEMQKTGEQMSKSDPTSSSAMKNAAQTGQQQQVPPNMSRAAQQAQQNQQAGAQGAQKQAELGLELILSELRQAERRKLEELAKKLAQMQEQLANLIRRQAGHNLDNLDLQNKTPDPRLLTDLLAKAERATPSPLAGEGRGEGGNAPAPKPQLPQLTAAQEQTERNTRDIAKMAEDLPSGAEPAAHLTRAAGKMERAIVSLRDQKLPDAYEPPQVEALAALEDARKKVDEQQAAVQDKMQQQEQEAIRQAYVKIKEEQEKLNLETLRLDHSPHLPDGSLKREDAVRLGKLPGQQGALSDRTAKLEDGLRAAGGIVYVWANKDIVKSMLQVKDDLGKPVTGVPTQSEQTRIVDQLDAMIRNLAIKPPDKKFEQRNSGGGGKGGGGGGPKLPSEAELRLLKDLQVAVNKSTKTIDAQPDKDKPKLLALGGRQGELRGIFDQLLQKASQGQLKLGPEPDNKDQLPEEAGVEQVENQELDQALLNDKPEGEKTSQDMMLVGQRMARSRQRLALNNDPGKTTQIIQDRILKNFDDLIDQARSQQANAQSKPGKGQSQPQPKPGQGQQPNNAQAQSKGPPKPNNAQTPAQNSSAPGAGDNAAELSQDIKEKMAEWGGITPRQRDAVIEGAGENIIEKYKKLTDDYYRSLATKATEH